MLQTVSGFLNRLIFGRKSKPAGGSQQPWSATVFATPSSKTLFKTPAIWTPGSPAGQRRCSIFAPSQKGFKDGPFSIEESSRPLLMASLAAAFVKNDDQGNTRLSKRNSDQKARDDVAAALTLAAGGWGRATLGGGKRRPQTKRRFS